MIENLILGIIQGIFEWLPVSSEGIIVLIKTNFFAVNSLENMIKLALFLHLGTLFASIIYFWKEIKELVITLFKYNTAEEETKKMFWFILIATIISGILGIIILKLLIYIESQLTITGTIISLIIGILLLCTGTILLISKKTGTKEIKDLKKRDYILLGILQGLAVLPGISRSGITSSGLLLRNFKPKVALRLSFILSIPIVLGGNIILNISNFIFDYELLLGLIFSFLFGIITIHLLIKIAEKINFGILLILFGIITILGTLLL